MPHHKNGSIHQLHTAIHRHRDTLTPTEVRIATYFLEQTQTVALLSVQELATRLHTGPASIVRVAKKLGYAGFSQLKNGLKSNLREEVSPMERFRLSLDGSEEVGKSEVGAIARQEARNIDATIRLLDEVTFRRAVELLGRAHSVHVLGAGISAYLAGLTALILQRIGLRSFAVQHTGLDVSEQLIGVGEGEVLLAFSFPPYSSQTVGAAAFVKRQGGAVVSITNQAIAPIAQSSDVLLVAKTHSAVPSNSLSAPLLLVHCLAAAIAASSRARSMKALKATLALRKEN